MKNDFLFDFCREQTIFRGARLRPQERLMKFVAILMAFAKIGFSVAKALPTVALLAVLGFGPPRQRADAWRAE